MKNSFVKYYFEKTKFFQNSIAISIYDGIRFIGCNENIKDQLKNGFIDNLHSIIKNENNIPINLQDEYGNYIIDRFDYFYKLLNLVDINAVNYEHNLKNLLY